MRVQVVVEQLQDNNNSDSMKKDSAIIIFVRHPELGKVKTRLAATIGNEKALAVYEFLLLHTFGLIKDLNTPVYVFYADNIIREDIWVSENVIKRLQQGNDLGDRMANAFTEVFKTGCSKVIIIGSDCYDLTTDLINEAFLRLEKNDIVIGPAKDGGYYLLGMNAPFKNLFQNIEWSTSTVLKKTIEKIEQNKYSVLNLPMLTDIDTEQDISFVY